MYIHVWWDLDRDLMKFSNGDIWFASQF